MTIAKWQIYHVPNCRHARPEPKNKFVLVAAVSAGMNYGFFINSQVTRFIYANGLGNCQVEILKNQHAFLKWDSWIDCTTLYAFANAELTDYKCDLDPGTRISVLNSVSVCRVLKPIFKNLVINK